MCATSSIYIHVYSNYSSLISRVDHTVKCRVTGEQRYGYNKLQPGLTNFFWKSARMKPKCQRHERQDWHSRWYISHVPENELWYCCQNWLIMLPILHHPRHFHTCYTNAAIIMLVAGLPFCTVIKSSYTYSFSKLHTSYKHHSL